LGCWRKYFILLQWIFFHRRKKKPSEQLLEWIVLLEKIFDFAPVEFFSPEPKKNHRSRYCCQRKYLILLQWIFFHQSKKNIKNNRSSFTGADTVDREIFDLAPLDFCFTGAVSLEQILWLEKIFNFAPVEFFFTGAKTKNRRSNFTGADTVARENI
jgi:hypothetical protein